MARILYLVRHAEPQRSGVILGALDSPLSAAGRAHAARLWEGREPLAAIFSSPLARALETARLIGPLEPVVVPGLSELSHGRWDGLSWEEAERADPDTARRKQADWLGVTAPGGEPWPDFRERVRRASAIVLRGPFPCAVVAHGAVNSALAQLLAGLDPIAFRQPYGGVFTLDIDAHLP